MSAHGPEEPRRGRFLDVLRDASLGVSALVLFIVVVLAGLILAVLLFGWGTMSWMDDGANPLNVGAAIIGGAGLAWFISAIGRNHRD